jgi:hypothetical protein
MAVDKLLHDSNITFLMPSTYIHTLQCGRPVRYAVIICRDVLTLLSQSWSVVIHPLSVPLLISSHIKGTEKLIRMVNKKFMFDMY